MNKKMQSLLAVLFFTVNANFALAQPEGEVAVKNTPDKINVITGEFHNGTEKILGYKLLKEREDKLKSYQYTMLSKKAILDKKYKSGEISFDDYLSELSVIVEDSLFIASSILDDGEFELLFSIPKDKIVGVVYMLGNLSRPKGDKLIDPR